MADLLKPDIIIESGTANGVSTELWGRYFDKRIYSVDSAKLYGLGCFQSTKNRLEKYPNVHLVFGDSFVEIPKLLRENPSSKAAIFIDGPKGANAVKLAEHCFLFRNAAFIGIHDLYQKHSDDLMNYTVFYTDEDWFINDYFYLNQLKSPNHILADQLRAFPRGMVMGFSVRNQNLFLRYWRYIKYLVASGKAKNMINSVPVRLATWASKNSPRTYVLLKKIKGFFCRENL